jgi:hypothetical protein
MNRKPLHENETSTEEPVERLPKSGDVFHCDGCGMELEVIADCACEGGPRLECCGMPMSKTDATDLHEA